MLDVFTAWFIYSFVFFVTLVFCLTLPFIAYFLATSLIRKVCKIFKR